MDFIFKKHHFKGLIVYFVFFQFSVKHGNVTTNVVKLLHYNDYKPVKVRPHFPNCKNYLMVKLCIIKNVLKYFFGTHLRVKGKSIR